MSAFGAAARSLIRRWSSTMTTVLVLAFSVGITTAVFSVEMRWC